MLLRTCDTRADDDAPWAGETQDRLRGNRLFKPQIRALLRAATDGDLRVVFPMIKRCGRLGSLRGGGQHLPRRAAGRGPRDRPDDAGLRCGHAVRCGHGRGYDGARRAADGCGY